ncbi:MAG TPA: TIGR04283 family arsenosugar biosynthesis glycosyltransferase [Methyloceanibacter sp.]|nr:TIGR04283 family arsenosugar biosynthesis glycosyltransferase [Methyloceanibacter sp.]
MISVVIPAYNAETTLGATLAALVPAVVDGIIQEAILVDGGSTDGTCVIGDAAGTRLIRTKFGRGMQLQAGATAARGDWLLFLHADTVLEPGWAEEAVAFIELVMTGRRAEAAAAFRFALDDDGLMPRLLESLVALRCFLFALPYGDQGLLISRKLYRELGGFRTMPLMEDVDLMRRVKRQQLVMLQSRAVTSGVRYRREGYIARSLRNLSCMVLYFLRVPTRVLTRIYG